MLDKITSPFHSFKQSELCHDRCRFSVRRFVPRHGHFVTTRGETHHVAYESADSALRALAEFQIHGYTDPKRVEHIRHQINRLFGIPTPRRRRKET